MLVVDGAVAHQSVRNCVGVLMIRELASECSAT